MQLFTLHRVEIVAALQHLSDQEWGRAGHHETAGEQSARTIVQDMIEHKAEHCAQLEALFQG